MTISGKSKAKTQADKERAAKADDPQAGADLGKIVNLMAGDATRARITHLIHLQALLMMKFRFLT